MLLLARRAERDLLMVGLLVRRVGGHEAQREGGG